MPFENALFSLYEFRMHSYTCIRVVSRISEDAAGWCACVHMWVQAKVMDLLCCYQETCYVAACCCVTGLKFDAACRNVFQCIAVYHCSTAFPHNIEKESCLPIQRPAKA